MTDTEQWLTRKDVAERLRVTVRTVDDYVRQGRLPRFRIAGSRTTRFRVEDVRALVVPNGCDQP
jgi:excisionase family DNA binding protein